MPGAPGLSVDKKPSVLQTPMLFVQHNITVRLQYHKQLISTLMICQWELVVKTTIFTDIHVNILSSYLRYSNIHTMKFNCLNI